MEKKTGVRQNGGKPAKASSGALRSPGGFRQKRSVRPLNSCVSLSATEIHELPPGVDSEARYRHRTTLLSAGALQLKLLP